jgi:hypothetical protein
MGSKCWQGRSKENLRRRRIKLRLLNFFSPLDEKRVWLEHMEDKLLALSAVLASNMMKTAYKVVRSLELQLLMNLK